MDFKYLNTVEDFKELPKFSKNNLGENKNDLGENIKLDRLVVMDSISRLADKSEEFANFLTVS